MNAMKFHLAIISIVLSFSLSLVSGQEPPLPAKSDTPGPSPTPASARPQLNIPEIPMSIDPPRLVPDTSLAIPRHQNLPTLPKNAPSLSEMDAAFQKSPLAREAEEYRLHVEWRQLQNRVANDPAVIAAKAATTTARTDLEKRARLRTYYNLSFARMQALASSSEVRSYLEGKKAAVLGSLAQSRVRPESTPEKSRKQ
jgi:hypothetical protein